MVAAPIEGIVSQDGMPTAAGSMALPGERLGQRWQSGAFAPDATGRFRDEVCRRASTGWYRGAGSGDAMLHADEIEVAPPR